MIVNQLLVLPTDDTLDYLTRVFSGCPFDLSLDKCYVEVNSSEHEMVADPSRLYKARAGTMKEYFDSASQSSWLLLPLDCPALSQRALEVRLEQDAPSAFYGDHYYPFMVVKPHMPPRYSSLRAFVNSVSNTLATTEDHPLLFEGEFVVASEFQAVPHADYYATMAVDGSSKVEPGLTHWTDTRNRGFE